MTDIGRTDQVSSESRKALETVCFELTYTEDAIDKALVELKPDTFAIKSANREIERRLSAQASLQMWTDGDSLSKRRKYNVTGTTKLRWLLDDDAPTFQKVDEAVANSFRKRLLQYYHPDKSDSGDLEMFNLVKHAVATSSMELLALMALNIGGTVSAEDLNRYTGAAYQRLARLRAGPSFRIMQKTRTGNSKQAKEELQELINKRAMLMKITMLQKYDVPDLPQVDENCPVDVPEPHIC